MVEPKIYSRFIKKDIDKLIHDLRRHPLDKELLIIDLGDNIYMRATRARCYLNAMILTAVDNYGIPKEVYRYLLFTGDIIKGAVTDYLQSIFELFKTLEFPHKNVMMSHILADIKMSFNFISLVCNDVVTADHSIVDYVDQYNTNSKFKELFTKPVFLPTDTPWDIRRKTDAVIQMFKDRVIDISPLSDFLRYGVKVKPEQIMFFFCYDIAPNFLNMKEALRPLGVGIINGIETVWSMFVLDNISRLAIIMGKNDVKVTGVQSKRFGISLQNTKINMADTRELIDDCGNTDYIDVSIKSKKDLDFFCYKDFYDNETHKMLGTITRDREDLIGKDLHIRTFMLCKAPIVCKACYGYNWEMVADTPLYKGNFSLYVLQEFNKKMQQVISVKHHTGWVNTPMPVKWGDIETTMDDLIRNYDIFTKVEWNEVTVNPKYSYEFIPFQVIEEKKKKLYFKEKLIIDGKELETKQMLKSLGDHKFSFTVPNDSVLLQAEDLKIAINKHSSVNKETGKPDFDATQLKGKTLSEQIKIMYEYEKSKVKMDHFIYYEALIHSLVRDADDVTSKPTTETKNLLLTHADHGLMKPERVTNISTVLPHGYINIIFNAVNTKCEPNEMDILYQNLTDRKISKKNIFADFNKIINEARIKHSEDVKINDKDNMSSVDMLGSDEFYIL